MKRPLLVGSVTMIALLLAAASLPPDKTKSEEAFDRLATLKGGVEGRTRGR